MPAERQHEDSAGRNPPEAPSRVDDGLRNKTLLSIGWVVVEKWGVRVVSLIVFAILTRLLDSGDFGLLSLAAVFTALLGVFVDSGFSKALVQRKQLGPKDADTAFWTSLAISVAIYALLAVSAPLVAHLLGDDRLAPVLWVMGAVLPISALSATPAALLERDFQFRSLSLRQLAGTAAGALIAVPLAFSGAGVWSLVAQPIATAAVSLVMLWGSTSWRPSFQFSKTSLHDLYGLGAGVLGIELLNTLQANIDKLLIGAFFSPAAVGYYYVGQKALTTLSELVTTVIARVSLTTFSRLQDDTPRLNRALQKMTFASGNLAIPVFGMTALLAPQLIPAVFGDGWGPAIPVFQILAVSAAVTSVTYYDQNVLLASGKSRAAFLLALGQNILGIVLVFAALPWGIVGVAAFRSLRVLLYWPVRLAVLRRAADIAIGPYVRQVALCLAGLLPVGVTVSLLQLTPWADTDRAFIAFVVPVGLGGLMLNATVAWVVMGRANRTMLQEALRPAMRAARRRRTTTRMEA